MPLFEGKMMWQFTHTIAEPRFWIDGEKGRRSLLGKETDIGQELGYQKYRIAYRAIASSTNERSIVATIIPPCFTGNSVNVSENLDSRTQLFCVSILNSLVIDGFLRQKVSANINMFYLYQLPVPRLTEKDAAFEPIVKRAARLICTTPEFDDLAKQVGLKSHEDGATDPAERGKLRAELDGLIAHLYGLTEEEFAHILTIFPLVPEPVKAAAMEAFKAFAPKSADAQLAAEIAAGESAGLEFKSSARWDFKENRVNKVLEQVILKTVAAFLNTDGGTLLIGVDDGGKVVGLEHDYKTLGKKQNRDGYENWLTTLLLEEFGKDSAPLVEIRFYEPEGKDVCRVSSKPSPKPVYVKEGNAEHLYIRAGNSTRQLTTREAVDYCKRRWPS